MSKQELSAVNKSIPARWFTPVGPSRKKRLGIVHSAEIENKPGRAVAVAKFFQNLPAKRKASAHLCIDMYDVVRGVADDDVAYAAPGANNDGLHIELAGYAKWQQGEWSQPQMIAMLRLAADAMREWCDLYNIPKRFVNAAGLKAGESGISTHFEVSQAWRKSDHWDPGTGFPIETFISMVVDQPPPQTSGDDVGVYLQTNCPTGGYWLVKRSDGGVFAYADTDGRQAPFFGSLPGLGVKPSTPIVAMTPYVVENEVHGYWLLGADGGVFTFGDAPFTDSYAGHPEWHEGKREFIGIEQHGAGYDLISVVVDSDPPDRNVYDLSTKR